MATEDEVQQANDAGALVDWSPCRAVCPSCWERSVEVRQAYRAKPVGSFSLAGAQVKFPAAIGWVYRCTACGATGTATPK